MLLLNHPLFYILIHFRYTQGQVIAGLANGTLVFFKENPGEYACTLHLALACRHTHTSYLCTYLRTSLHLCTSNRALNYFKRCLNDNKRRDDRWLGSPPTGAAFPGLPSLAARSLLPGKGFCTVGGLLEQGSRDRRPESESAGERMSGGSLHLSVKPLIWLLSKESRVVCELMHFLCHPPHPSNLPSL